MAFGHLEKQNLREPQSRAPTAPRCVRSRGVCARTRWPFAGHWAIAQMGGVKTASRGGLRSRIRAPREMAVCHAFGQGGDARWPFARHPASEMAVCQAPGQRDGRLPGIRPALRAAAHPTLAKFSARMDIAHSHEKVRLNCSFSLGNEEPVLDDSPFY